MTGWPPADFLRRSGCGLDTRFTCNSRQIIIAVVCRQSHFYKTYVVFYKEN